MKNTDKKSELSRTSRIFFKTCLIGIGLCVVVPLIYFIGVYFIDLIMFILNGLYQLFIDPFYHSNTELGVWSNLLRFLPYFLIFLYYLCAVQLV
jgi:hypothetical protein